MQDWVSVVNIMDQVRERVAAGLLVEWGKTVLLIVLTIVVGRLALRFVQVVIRTTFELSDSRRVRLLSEQRVSTLTGLLMSVASYAVNFLIILTVLQLLGIPTAHVLAGAGIVGLAVGFGAQNFVKDIIGGFFILYEDQFGVGDVVSLAGVQGTVEEMGLRVTRIRDFDGSLHVVPNGDIGQVNNRSRGTSRIILDVEVAYEEELAEVLAVLERVCSQFKNEALVEAPRVLGVQALGESAIVIRLFARTEPLEHWGLERQLRLEVKKALDAAGIEIPYRRLVILPREESASARTVEEAE